LISAEVQTSVIKVAGWDRKALAQLFDR